MPNFNRDAVVIRLHGFFQTDDRIAIQEITRQLFMEKESANKVFGSFAGIQSTILYHYYYYIKKYFFKLQKI